MAWGERKELTADDLKKAGLDPDEIKTKLGAAVTQEQLTTATTTIMDGIRNQFAELEGKLASKPANSDDGNGNGGDGNSGDKGGNNNRPVTIDPLEFLNDPQTNTQNIVRQEMQGLATHTLQMGADMAYRDAKNNLPLFKRYEKEIKEQWDKYPLKFKTQPEELITNMYKIVVANHIDEIATEAGKNNGAYNVVQAGGNNGNVNTDSKPDPVKSLTAKELAIAKGFGMTAEEYAKQKGEMSYV